MKGVTQSTSVGVGSCCDGWDPRRLRTCTGGGACFDGLVARVLRTGAGVGSCVDGLAARALRTDVAALTPDACQPSQTACGLRRAHTMNSVSVEYLAQWSK